MNAGDPTWYYAWVPGPWLRISAPEWPQPLGYVSSAEALEVECEVCGQRRTFASDAGDASHKEALLRAREHWEDHARSDDLVTFFPLPGVGDTKAKASGTWADVVRSVPYLLWDGGPVPPQSVVNEVLAEGAADAGMSGGCEWPRHQLTDEEYAVLWLDLVAVGYLGVDAPEWVRGRADYEDWKMAVRAGCSPEAAQAYRRELTRLTHAMGEAVRRGGWGSPECDAVAAEQRRLASDQEGWLRDFDQRTR